MSDGSALYEEGFFTEEGAEGAADDITLERCAHCVARTISDHHGGTNFTPAWTMEGIFINS